MASQPTAETVRGLDGVETKIAPSPLVEEGPRSAAALYQTVMGGAERTEPAAAPLTPAPPSTPLGSPKSRTLLFAAVAVAAVAIAGWGVGLASSAPSASAPTTIATSEGEPAIHTLRLTSTPTGAEVYEDGERLGHTPIEVSRPLGHRTQLRLVLEGRHPVTRTFGFFRDDEASVVLGGDGTRSAAELTPSALTDQRPQP